MGLLHLLEYLIYIGVLVEVLHGADDIVEREFVLVQLAEQVLEVDHPDYLVETAVTHGIDLEEVLLDEGVDLLAGHLPVYPDDLVAAGHYRLDAPVTQGEHSLHDVLLHILYLAVLLALGHHRLDLLLSHLRLLLLHVEGLGEERCALVQYPHERGRYPGEDQHRAGYDLGDVLGRTHAQTLGHQLAEDYGQVGHDDDDGHLSYRLGHALDQSPALKDVRELVCYRVSGIETGEDTDEGDAYLDGGEELVGLLRQAEHVFGCPAALLSICGKA